MRNGTNHKWKNAWPKSILFEHSLQCSSIWRYLLKLLFLPVHLFNYPNNIHKHLFNPRLLKLLHNWILETGPKALVISIASI
jgi:hypothetical protein